MSTDEEWEKWGASDPYFGVLTNPKFRAAILTEDSKTEFFNSGRMHVSYVMNTLRRHLDAQFAPQTVLDFGCGVGRLVIPFAADAQQVVGIDVSPSMLAEAGRNCELRQVGNVSLLLSDDNLSAVADQFDLVHSCIVLQHIEVERGRLLFRRLVERVRPGGMGALHVTFGWDLHAATFGQPAPPVVQEAPPPSALVQAKSQLRKLLEPIGMGRPAPEPPPVDPNPDPEMQMNYYNLSELFFILQQAGVAGVYTDITDHGGAMGAFLFFQRSGPTA